MTMMIVWSGIELIAIWYYRIFFGPLWSFTEMRKNTTLISTPSGYIEQQIFRMKQTRNRISTSDIHAWLLRSRAILLSTSEGILSSAITWFCDEEALHWIRVHCKRVKALWMRSFRLQDRPSCPSREEDARLRLIKKSWRRSHIANWTMM